MVFPSGRLQSSSRATQPFPSSSVSRSRSGLTGGSQPATPLKFTRNQRTSGINLSRIFQWAQSLQHRPTSARSTQRPLVPPPQVPENYVLDICCPISTRGGKVAAATQPSVAAATLELPAPRAAKIAPPLPSAATTAAVAAICQHLRMCLPRNLRHPRCSIRSVLPLRSHACAEKARTAAKAAPPPPK